MKAAARAAIKRAVACVLAEKQRQRAALVIAKTVRAYCEGRTQARKAGWILFAACVDYIATKQRLRSEKLAAEERARLEAIKVGNNPFFFLETVLPETNLCDCLCKVQQRAEAEAKRLEALEAKRKADEEARFIIWNLFANTNGNT